MEDNSRNGGSSKANIQGRRNVRYACPTDVLCGFELAYSLVLLLQCRMFSYMKY